MLLVDALLQRLQAMRQRAKGKDAFKHELLQAMADGVLSPEETSHLDTLKQDLGLTEAEVRGLRVEAYQVALRATTSDGAVTQQEADELARIRRYLGVSEQDAKATKVDLVRLRLIAEIRASNLPTVTVLGLVSQKGERVHWAEPGSLLEERVVRRRYEGGSSGVSLRIAKGVTYRVGACRGRLVSDKAIVAVSSGELILTDRRVVFRGDAKSFACRIDKLLDLALFADGVRVTDQTGRPKTVQLSSPENVDIVGMVLTHVVNQVTA